MNLEYRNVTISDAVTTLMYASAVNVVLARSVSMGNSGIFISIGMILFIFIDWLGRIWIPISFPSAEDQAERKGY